jgi:integrase
MKDSTLSRDQASAMDRSCESLANRLTVDLLDVADQLALRSAVLSSVEEHLLRDLLVVYFRRKRKANEGIAERITMEWLGHSASAMVKHFYHLADDEAKRRMQKLNPLGKSGGRSAADDEQKQRLEDAT